MKTFLLLILLSSTAYAGINFAMSSHVDPADIPEFYNMHQAVVYAYQHVGDQSVALGLRIRVMYDVKLISRLMNWEYKTMDEKLLNHKKAHQVANRIPFYRRALKIVDPENLGCSVHSYSIPWKGKK